MKLIEWEANEIQKRRSAVSLDFNYFPPEGVWHELQNILQ